MSAAAATPETRAICLERAGHRCESCIGALDGPFGYSLQHRDARGMGGSRRRELALPSNLLVLCGSGTTGCHGWVENHPAEAYELGLALRTGWLPDQTPYCNDRGEWRLLLDDGTSISIQMPWRRP